MVVRREGRFRWNHLNPLPIQQIYERWISPHMAQRTQVAMRLKKHVEAKQKGRKKR